MSNFVVKNGLSIGGGSKLKSGTITGNATLDLTTGNYFDYTPTADATFVFSNPPAGGKAHGFALKVTGADIGASYDIANAVYDGVSFSVNQQESSPQGVFFKPDGLKMYVTGFSGDAVYEYTLSTAWDVSTASFVQSFSVAAQGTSPHGIFFKSDGARFYVMDRSTTSVLEYTLSTAWDISTASYVQSFSVSAQTGIPFDLHFSDDGLVLFVLSNNTLSVVQYNLSTAWDISTASFVVSATIFQTSDPSGMFFSSLGTKMFVVAAGNDAVFEYSLSTAWNVSTRTYIRSFAIAQDTAPRGVTFKTDGTKMYIMGDQLNTIFQYSTGVSDIATFTYPASVKFPNGTPPTAPAVGETDVLTFYTDDGGASYYGFQAGDAMQ